MTELGRILFADDEETFLQASCDLLRREGYACDGVPDASAAMQKLAAKKYDLLIADIKMPGNAELEFEEIVKDETAFRHRELFCTLGLMNLLQGISQPREA